MAGWIPIVLAVPLALYGLLNLASPATTIRWQRRSTDRAERRGSDFGQAVGSGFARMVGATGDAPWEDPDVRRRVRLIGVAEIILASFIAALGPLAT
jgi:hypothetical protein